MYVRARTVASKISVSRSVLRPSRSDELDYDAVSNAHRPYLSRISGYRDEYLRYTYKEQAQDRNRVAIGERSTVRISIAIGNAMQDRSRTSVVFAVKAREHHGGTPYNVEIINPRLCGP